MIPSLVKLRCYYFLTFQSQINCVTTRALYACSSANIHQKSVTASTNQPSHFCSCFKLNIKQKINNKKQRNSVNFMCTFDEAKIWSMTNTYSSVHVFFLVIAKVDHRLLTRPMSAWTPALAERERPIYTGGKITCTCRVRTVQGSKHGVMGESGIPKLMGYPYILSVKIAQNRIFTEALFLYLKDTLTMICCIPYNSFLSYFTFG